MFPVQALASRQMSTETGEVQANLVARLDGGLQARLGKQFGGAELSGGE